MAVGTTRGKRRLGRHVRPILLRSGMKPEAVAQRAVCSPQTVNRLLAGHALPGKQRFLTILALIGATDTERADALQMYEVADIDTATIQHAEGLSPKYRRFRMDEAEAVLERTLDTVIITGLLQTSAYAAAISQGRRRLLRPADWEARAGDERLARRELLMRERNPLALHALIHEAALRTEVGGADVMTDQLDHLLDMAALPQVTVQVVPFGFGAHGAMTGPSFLLSFEGDDEPDSAYAESVTGIDTVDKAEDLAGLTDVWQAIADAAPGAADSMDIIRQVRDGTKGR